MRAGRLNEVIDIYEESTVVDPDYGSETASFTKLLTTRAEVKFTNGSESLSNNTIVNTSAVVFWLRIREGISETMQVEWRGCRYSIEYIEWDRKLKFLRLQTSKILN